MKKLKAKKTDAMLRVSQGTQAAAKKFRAAMVKSGELVAARDAAKRAFEMATESLNK